MGDSAMPEGFTSDKRGTPGRLQDFALMLTNARTPAAVVAPPDGLRRRLTGMTSTTESLKRPLYYEHQGQHCQRATRLSGVSWAFQLLNQHYTIPPSRLERMAVHACNKSCELREESRVFENSTRRLRPAGGVRSGLRTCKAPISPYSARSVDSGCLYGRASLHIETLGAYSTKVSCAS